MTNEKKITELITKAEQLLNKDAPKEFKPYREVLKQITAELRNCKKTFAEQAKTCEETIDYQKESEHTLKLYESIFSTSNVGIGITNTEGYVAECNESFAQMLDYGKSEIIGKHVHELSFESDIEYEIQQFEKLTPQNPQTRFEKRYSKKDGSILWADLTANVIFENNRPRYIVGILVDITEKKNAEIQLKDSEQKYRELFEANLYSISIFRFEPDGKPGKFIDMNENAAKLIGYSKEEALEFTPIDLEHNVGPEKFEERMQQFAQKGRASFETQLRHKNGSLIDVEVHATPVNYNKQPAIMNVSGDISERKKAEKQIAEREEQFRTIFDRSPQPMALSETETGKIIQVNDIFCKTVQGKKSDIQGKTVTGLGFYSENDRNMFVRELLTKGKVEGLEMDFTTLKNKRLTAKMFAQFITVNGQKYILTIFEDITQRKVTEEELQMLSAVVKQSPSYIVITDLEGKIEYANPAFTDITGYRFEEVKNQNPRILKSGKVKPETYQELWDTITSGKPWRGEFINRRKSGEEYIEKVVIAPIKNKNGEIIKYFAIKEDITQQIETENALKESENKFKAITAYAKDAIILIDDEDTVKFWNKAAGNIFGYTPDEILGNKMHPLILPGKYNERFKKGFEHFKQSGTGIAIKNTVQMSGLRKSGEEFPVEISISAIHIKNQLHAIGIIRDITERKQAENKLNTLISELETANATKDKFFNIIAHDLKNPFNSIVGFSGLLAKQTDKYDTQKIKKFAETIHSSSKNTYKLLENLLEWSRAQTDKISFEPENIILENTLIETIGLSQNAAENKRIEISYELTDSIVLRADQNMLNTIMRNLISNAVKFTKEGGKVEIKAELQKSMAFISVSDTGIGMPEDTVKKLFMIHEKVSKPGTNNEKGTGLGLLLCKEFVEKHSGKIWAESTENKGSTFSFTMPIAQ